MTVNFQAANYYSNGSYNPKKKVNKAGFIGAGVGLVAGAGLQYGGGELIANILQKNSESFANKTVEALVNDKKGLTRFYAYILEIAARAKEPFNKWKGIGVAGLIGATIVGLASALKTAKKQLPENC